MIIIVCGVSGTGKSTIGKLLADTLHIPFYDADDFHSTKNIQKMRSGLALTDEDRAPWLESLSIKLSQWESQQGAVLACSSLKESYRKLLSSKCNLGIHWVMLNGSKELLTERLNSRKGHYFDSSLLSSQLNTLELPSYGLVVNVQLPPEKIINQVLEFVKTT